MRSDSLSIAPSVQGIILIIYVVYYLFIYTHYFHCILGCNVFHPFVLTVVVIVGVMEDSC